jgi:hypothetical protein
MDFLCYRIYRWLKQCWGFESIGFGLRLGSFGWVGEVLRRRIENLHSSDTTEEICHQTSVQLSMEKIFSDSGM